MDQLARDTGFVQRRSKLSGDVFLQSLVLNELDYSSLTLQEICCKLQAQYAIEISKQGVDQRFNEAAVDFFKAVLSLKLSKQITNGSLDCLEHFKTVKIKDSTRFVAPSTLSEKYPSHGAGGHLAGLSIAYEFDLKSGRIADLSIHPSIRQDHVDAKENLSTIQPGDLLIRDLGFISVEVLSEIEKRKAFYVNRLHTNTSIYEVENERFVKMDYYKMYRFMKKHSLLRHEKEVFIGDRQKLPVRMIIEMLPDDEVAKRFRKINQKAKRSNWKVSKSYKSKAYFNLFVTNAESSTLPAEQIGAYYKLRWQIELMFKVFKSTFHIHELKPMSPQRYQCHLYAKLIWILISKNIFDTLNFYSWKTKQQLISILKVFNHLKNIIPSMELFIIRQDNRSLTKLMRVFLSFAFKHLLLEMKKNKIGLEHLLKEKISV